MADILRWFDTDRAAFFLECGPFILLGIAWLALRPRGRAHRQFQYDDSGKQPLNGRQPLPMPTVPESLR